MTTTTWKPTIRQWLDWKLHPVKDWVTQLWFAHDNARTLSDMEWRFGCVLNHVTRGMSKAYYTKEAMIAEIDEFLSEQYDEAYLEGQSDTRQEYNGPLQFALELTDPNSAIGFLNAWNDGEYDVLTREWPEWAIQVAHPENRE